MEKFKQVIKWLREGKKVRRPSWEEGSYWMLDDDETILWQDNRSANIHINQIEADDWEIYEEEKEFTENQLNTIKEIQKILCGFGCNSGICLEGKCPFSIGSCSHKYSEGCLHKRLYDLLKKHKVI